MTACIIYRQLIILFYIDGCLRWTWSSTQFSCILCHLPTMINL